LAEVQIALTDDILDVLVQTVDWRRLFAHCIAVPTPTGCGYCGSRRGHVALSDGDRSRVKDCLLTADPARISSLKSALRATKLVVFTRAASGTLQQHII
jgi:hypothetical protein